MERVASFLALDNTQIARQGCSETGTGPITNLVFDFFVIFLDLRYRVAHSIMRAAQIVLISFTQTRQRRVADN